MALQANLASEMKGGALAIQRILGEPAEGSDGHEKRRQLRMIDEFEMERLLLRGRGAGDQQRQIQRNHRGRRTELAGDGREMIPGYGADGAADIDDFRGS